MIARRTLGTVQRVLFGNPGSTGTITGSTGEKYRTSKRYYREVAQGASTLFGSRCDGASCSNLCFPSACPSRNWSLRTWLPSSTAFTLLSLPKWPPWTLSSCAVKAFTEATWTAHNVFLLLKRPVQSDVRFQSCLNYFFFFKCRFVKGP